jgi:hypothetical protein
MKRARGIAWWLFVGMWLLTFIPFSAAQASSPPSGTVVTPTVLPSIQGNVTNCTTQATCVYAFSNALGSGWATSTLSTTTGPRMAFQLPGEAAASYNLSYSTSTAKVTNNYPTYIYWTVGSFIGTDLTTGHIVYGTTSTNYSATCHVVFRWCHYTYVTDNGTIVAHLTRAEATATSISCSPSTLHPQQKTSCQASVTNHWNVSNYPTGKVHFRDGGSGLGTFSNKGVCTLANGTCSFTFKTSDNACGLIDLSASYGGTAAYYKSNGEVSVDVYVSGGC